jgi:hypothetical protein
MRYVSALIVVSAALLGAVALIGQEPGQSWRLKKSDSSDMVRFTVERREANNRWSNSTDVPLTRFRGFSTGLFENGGPARFEYVQDAGKLVCEGSFSMGSGSGKFTFVADAGFRAELNKLGYQTPDDDQIFTMMMTNVSLQFAKEVKEAGLGATTKQLVELRIHGVDSNYIRETREAGYKDFIAKDYTEMRIHGVSTAFLKDLKKSGYNLNAHEIAELRIHGVSSEFIAELKNAGYDLPARQIAELRIHGVSPDYIRSLKTYGLKPSASDLTQLRIHGVSTEFLKDLKDAGYGTMSVEDVTRLRIHGVSSKFIRDSKDLGYNFSPAELADLRIHGVDGNYLRKLRDSGMKNLTAAQIAKLRMHGVD